MWLGHCCGTRAMLGDITAEELLDGCREGDVIEGTGQG
jgi:hypothetical protein